MTKILPGMNVIRVQRDQIHVDESINSRHKLNLSPKEGADKEERADARGIKGLADQIRESGLLQPPILLPMKQAGPDYDNRKEDYLLVVGFRRQLALDSLGYDEAQYSIAPPTWTLTEAMAANLIENLGREDLTPFETAGMCARLKEEHGLSYAEIAKRIRGSDSDPEGKQTLSESHVENMVRTFNKLNPSIKKHWQAGHEAASMRFLIKLSAMKPDEQDSAWKLKTEGPPPAADDGGKGKKGKGNARRDRPSDSDCAVMIARLESDKSNGADFNEGAIEALKWAAGIQGATMIGTVGFEKPAKAAKTASADGGKKKKGKKASAAGKGEGAAPNGAANNASA